ncbi:MAG: PorT family protein [Muribaculaceae bacterium]|nr:PorT family protein [Muribaculaceae bacterium]
MKHRLLTMLILPAMLTVAAMAADSTEDNSGPIWGVRATFDVNIPGKYHVADRSVKMFNTGYGGSVGAVCNLYLGNRFYFEPGVSLYYDTYKYEDLTISAEPSDAPQVFDPGLYKFGVRVPLVAGYTIPLRNDMFLSVYTGPELNCSLRGEIRLSESEKQFMPETSLFGDEWNFRRFDMAWKVGVAFPVWNVTVSIDAAIGVTDLMKGDIDFRENRCSVGVTYYW